MDNSFKHGDHQHLSNTNMSVIWPIIGWTQQEASLSTLLRSEMNTRQLGHIERMKYGTQENNTNNILEGFFDVYSFLYVVNIVTRDSIASLF